MKKLVSLLLVLWSVGSVAGEMLYCPHIDPPTVHAQEGLKITVPQGIVLDTAGATSEAISLWGIYFASAAQSRQAVQVVYREDLENIGHIQLVVPIYKGRCRQSLVKMIRR